MYCKRCGKEIQNNWNFCPKCKLSLTNENIIINKSDLLQKQIKDKKGSIICITLFLLGILGFFTFKKYLSLFFYISFISIVTGFIKYPQSKMIKFLFLLYLLVIILFVIAIIILIFSFFYIGIEIFNSCKGLG